jgi:BirA family biotin operon repressor/biotin-[acetyl-CoA-carboxylase] ligase
LTWVVEEVGVIGSTNDEAMARGRAGAPHGTVISATAQTKGRGRQGRSWHAPPGENLTLSVVLRPKLPPAAVPPLTLAAGVAVWDALNSLGFRASIKWPNDLLIEGKKVAGILTETSTRGDRLDLAVVGVGLNVNTTAFPAELDPIATSLAIVRGERLDLGSIRTLVARHLEERIERFLVEGPADAVTAFKERTDLLGRRVRSADVEGLAVDVDEAGALWLETDAGRRVRIVAGEVTA